MSTKNRIFLVEGIRERTEKALPSLKNTGDEALVVGEEVPRKFCRWFRTSVGTKKARTGKKGCKMSPKFTQETEFGQKQTETNHSTRPSSIQDMAGDRDIYRA